MLLQSYESLSAVLEMIDTKALRQKILDMAIRGQLVPQDPNDEPASVLLEKIRAEKQRLIKEGKIKKDKADSVIFKGDDNRHYENLPTGWVVCSIADLIFLRTGATFDKASVLSFEDAKSIRVLRGGNISTYQISLKDDDIFIPSATVSDIIRVQQYDIVTPAVTSLDNIGKMARVDYMPTTDITIGGFVYLLTPLFHDNIFSKFLLYQLTSNWFIEQLKFIAKKSGSAFYNINKNVFSTLPIYLPPLPEQRRIVKRIDELFTQINIINNNQTDIQTLYDELKKRTLDLAIQGKLVPQDQNDEPASVLLEKIRAEKKARLGKKYIDSYIYKGDDNCYYEKIGSEMKNITEEIPFDIPDTWVWTRLKNIVFSHGQKTPDNQFCYIDIGSIDNECQKLSREETVLEANDAPSRARKVVKFGDILYATVRPYLHNMCIVNKYFSHEAIASTGFAVMSCEKEIYNHFLFYYLLSPTFDKYANSSDNSKGVAYPAINDDKLYKALVPIPPYNEQIKIGKHIQLILSCADKDEF